MVSENNIYGLRLLHSPTFFGTLSRVFLLMFILASPVVGDSCHDHSWSDAVRNKCSTYTSGGYCSPDGQYGPNWSFGAGWFSIPFFANGGYDAFSACCGCGGGDSYSPPTCQLTDWSGWSECITFSCGSPQRIRTRNITAWGPDCPETEQRLDCPDFVPMPCPGKALFAAGYNGEGQMGVGNVISSPWPVQIKLPNGRPVTDAAGGYSHTAIISAGQLFMTGFNRFGQLGLGDSFTRLHPQWVPFPHSDIRSIAKVTCGSFQTAFLTDAGWLFAMGRNNFGQLGLGDTVDRFAPTQILGLYDITAIALGYQHFLVVANGALYAAGSGKDGRLGLGDLRDHYNLTRVSLNGTVTLIAAGTAHSLAVVDGDLYGMGYNRDGRLGLYDGASKVWPVKIPTMFDGVPPTDIAAGNAHSAILQNGEIYTSGDNTNGQLVSGDVSPNRAGWGKVESDEWFHPSQVVAMHKGTMVYGNNIGMIAGYNRHGQLGIGETNNYRSSFVLIRLLNVSDERSILAIFPGYYTTLFLAILAATPTPTPTVAPTSTFTNTPIFPETRPSPAPSPIPLPSQTFSSALPASPHPLSSPDQCADIIYEKTSDPTLSQVQACSGSHTQQVLEDYNCVIQPGCSVYICSRTIPSHVLQSLDTTC